MTRKQRRLTMIGGALAVLAIAAALVLNAMRDSIVFFSTPSMAAEKQIPAGKRFRLGGLVQPGSLKRSDNLVVNFAVADGSNLEETRIEDLLRPEPVSVGPDTAPDLALRTMLLHRVQHLPVVDGGRLVGIVDMADLCRALMPQADAAT